MIKYKEIPKEGYQLIVQEDGPELGYSNESGVKILDVDSYAFKDLSGDGKLDLYEDWRLPADVRARDLASKLSIKEIAGLMLYSSHQSIPAMAQGGPFASTYNGKPYDEVETKAWELTDQQKSFITKDHLRHVLITVYKDVETCAIWNNKLQGLAESMRFAIPANNSSDPRHSVDDTKEFNMGGGVSNWPEHLGMAATFDPSIVKKFGQVASAEYRALGIATALSPQSDLASEPRWGRFNGTFGEGSQLVTDITKAYCDGFQTTYNDSKDIIFHEHEHEHEHIENNVKIGKWGKNSVNTMVKHWPGGGSGEGGRDAHFAYGKFGVYPGNNFEEHLKAFVEGAFDLEEGTKMASAIMPYYTISHGIDKMYGENVGNSFSKYMISDLLRQKYGYDGVVCTDWAITRNHGPKIENFSGKCWGTENMTEVERHYKVLMAGCDQFGGNNDIEPVLQAYELGVEEHGETFMRARFEESAIRLLRNIFQVGLFENPYLDVVKSKAIVMKDDFINAGEEAMEKSVVLLKNKNNVLPLKNKTKVYIPKRATPQIVGWFGNVMPENTVLPIQLEIIKDYLEIVETPSEAEVAVVIARGPMNVLVTGGYEAHDLDRGGNGYVPISLQYRPYTARKARGLSLAGGDPLEKSKNRSYVGKTVKTFNESDLDMILETKKAMVDKPVIVVLQLDNPCVPGEFEGFVDGILLDFKVGTKVLGQVLTGVFEPSGLLPMQLPKDMETVEAQDEDVPRDMDPYVDELGNSYDFGYGLSYNGIIKDWRTKRYC